MSTCHRSPRATRTLRRIQDARPAAKPRRNRGLTTYSTERLCRKVFVSAPNDTNEVLVNTRGFVHGKLPPASFHVTGRQSRSVSWRRRRRRTAVHHLPVSGQCASKTALDTAQVDDTTSRSTHGVAAWGGRRLSTGSSVVSVL